MFHLSNLERIRKYPVLEAIPEGGREGIDMKQGVYFYRRDFLEENSAICIQSLKNLHIFHLVISFLRIYPKEIIKVLQ